MQRPVDEVDNGCHCAAAPAHVRRVADINVGALIPALLSPSTPPALTSVGGCSAALRAVPVSRGNNVTFFLHIPGTGLYATVRISALMISIHPLDRDDGAVEAEEASIGPHGAARAAGCAHFFHCYRSFALTSLHCRRLAGLNRIAVLSVGTGVCLGRGSGVRAGVAVGSRKRRRINPACRARSGSTIEAARLIDERGR